VRQKIEIEKWQLVLFIVGAIMIIVGLVIIILWQRGFIQLRWLPCPGYKIPLAKEPFIKPHISI